MAYTRRDVKDGETVMNKELYDNLQDGIDEVLNDIAVLKEATVHSATVEEVEEVGEEV